MQGLFKIRMPFKMRLEMPNLSSAITFSCSARQTVGDLHLHRGELKVALLFSFLSFPWKLMAVEAVTMST